MCTLSLTCAYVRLGEELDVKDIEDIHVATGLLKCMPYLSPECTFHDRH
jgi:hypothetical protein